MGRAVKRSVLDVSVVVLFAYTKALIKDFAAVFLKRGAVAHNFVHQRCESRIPASPFSPPILEGLFLCNPAGWALVGAKIQKSLEWPRGESQLLVRSFNDSGLGALSSSPTRFRTDADGSCGAVIIVVVLLVSSAG